MADRMSGSGINYNSGPISIPTAEAGEFPYRSGIHPGMYKANHGPLDSMQVLETLQKPIFG